jgi:endoglucanase
MRAFLHTSVVVVVAMGTAWVAGCSSSDDTSGDASAPAAQGGLAGASGAGSSGATGGQAGSAQAGSGGTGAAGKGASGGAGGGTGAASGSGGSQAAGAAGAASGSGGNQAGGASGASGASGAAGVASGSGGNQSGGSSAAGSSPGGAPAGGSGGQGGSSGSSGAGGAAGAGSAGASGDAGASGAQPGGAAGQPGGSGGDAGSSGNQQGGTGGSSQAGAAGDSGSSGSSGSGGAGGSGGSGGSLAGYALAGVSLAAAEFGEGNLPGTYGSDYTYPTHQEVDYFVGKGLNVMRLPFRWERLQHQTLGDLDAAELARLDDVVTYVTAKGAWALIDPHNYARHGGKLVGSDLPAAVLADFWSRLAAHYSGNDHVIFGLMNEPNSMPTEQWLGDANAAIAAVRTAGAKNLVMVPGNAWTGAHSWSDSWYGKPNAEVMLGVVDPGDNYVFEVHQYLDGDSSGQSPDCTSVTIGSERLKSFTSWLKQHGKRGFLGEFAGGRNDTCYAALDDMLSHLQQNGDAWLGWAYWAAGPWWGDYIYTLEPSNGMDRPQMAVLTKHLPLPCADDSIGLSECGAAPPPGA